MSCVATLTSVQAQTILSGDHVVEGDLEVGTPTDRGGITITGGTGNTASPGIKVTGDGGVLFEGRAGFGMIPTEGAGVRMMWYPKKAAFVVGQSSISDEEIGYNSVLLGGAVAMGESSAALSLGMAFSEGATAFSAGDAGNPYSVAMAGGSAYGDHATAMSNGVAWDNDATAMSNGSAFGGSSVAMGMGEAYGEASLAIGRGVAYGQCTVALSKGQANGDFSVAIGEVLSNSYKSVVVGRFNYFEEYESLDEWIEEEPLFVVGNGTGKLADPPERRRRNAFMIRKNGNFEMNGDVEMMAKVKMPRQGDILMGEFGEIEP